MRTEEEQARTDLVAVDAVGRHNVVNLPGKHNAVMLASYLRVLLLNDRIGVELLKVPLANWARIDIVDDIEDGLVASNRLGFRVVVHIHGQRVHVGPERTAKHSPVTFTPPATHAHTL